MRTTRRWSRVSKSRWPRYKRITEFVTHYGYGPPYDLKSATADLHAETGEVVMALIRTKIKRTKEDT